MIEIKELQPNIASSGEGLQPSLEAVSFETEIKSVSPTQEINPTVEIKNTEVRETNPQIQKSLAKVNTFKERTFDINDPIKEGSTWLEILEAKRLREELPQ